MCLLQGKERNTCPSLSALNSNARYSVAYPVFCELYRKSSSPDLSQWQSTALSTNKTIDFICIVGKTSFRNKSEGN